MSAGRFTRFAEGADGSRRLWLWCPGCDELHQVVDGTWTVDVTDPERPTVSPSILVQGIQWDGAEFPREFRPTHAGVPAGGTTVCHSFVRNGQWEFLSDSTHKLSGQTVPVVPLPDWCWHRADQKGGAS